jgi:hypothetical protein
MPCFHHESWWPAAFDGSVCDGAQLQMAWAMGVETLNGNECRCACHGMPLFLVNGGVLLGRDVFGRGLRALERIANGSPVFRLRLCFLG